MYTVAEALLFQFNDASRFKQKIGQHCFVMERKIKPLGTLSAGYPVSSSLRIRPGCSQNSECLWNFIRATVMVWSLNSHFTIASLHYYDDTINIDLQS